MRAVDRFRCQRRQLPGAGDQIKLVRSYPVGSAVASNQVARSRMSGALTMASWTLSKAV